MRLFRPTSDTGILRYARNTREPYPEKSDKRERQINAEQVLAQHTGASKTCAHSLPDPTSILFKVLKSSVVQ